MAKVSTLTPSKTHRIIIFGAPKTGKTLLACKLAEYYDILLIDMEKGYETVFQLPKEWQERIELVALPDTRSYPIAIETCLKLVKGPVSICNEHGKVGCMLCRREEKESIDIDLPHLGPGTVVIFDSLTRLIYIP